MVSYALALVLMSSAASAQVGLFVDYWQWDAMPSDRRVAYIMGAYDTLAIVPGTDLAKRLSFHRHQCMEREQMTGELLAERVKDYASSRPQLRNEPVQAALIGYLDALCGTLP